MNSEFIFSFLTMDTRILMNSSFSSNREVSLRSGINKDFMIISNQYSVSRASFKEMFTQLVKSLLEEALWASRKFAPIDVPDLMTCDDIA